MPSDLALLCYILQLIRQPSANSQRHVDRQDIHTVGGVVGDLGDGLTDDGCKVRIIGIEAQLGTMPDVGHWGILIPSGHKSWGRLCVLLKKS